ncbi:MAG: nicotinate (nicotinamide) nucleotide adenylyltransferase [Phycisphaerae bacterium]|nr:nicotinate (nicotinamide) nucleotide adenylyltransferase [Phycisphaerae bacterium]
MIKKKIALFGGTFDPVHLGHTAVAAAAAEHIGAEKIVFIPAKRSPLKTSLPQVKDDDRLAMIALAIADDEKFLLSDYELRKTRPSYTLETVRYFQADYSGEALIYWLIGADSIDELSRWYGISELIDECNLSVMFRAGCKPPNFTKFEDIWGAARVEKLQKNIIQTPLIDISSTEIRNRLVAGGDVTDMLAPAVADYIREHGLYQSGAKS